MNETQAIAKFKKSYPDDLFFKLHGGMFQSALPDIIQIPIDSCVRFLEFKIVDGTTLPWSKCRLAQHLTMLKMSDQGAYVAYIVYSRKSENFHTVFPNSVIEGKTTKLE